MGDPDSSFWSANGVCTGDAKNYDSNNYDAKNYTVSALHTRDGIGMFAARPLLASLMSLS